MFSSALFLVSLGHLFLLLLRYAVLSWCRFGFSVHLFICLYPRLLLSSPPLSSRAPSFLLWRSSRRRLFTPPFRTVLSRLSSAPLFTPHLSLSSPLFCVRALYSLYSASTFDLRRLFASSRFLACLPSVLNPLLFVFTFPNYYRLICLYLHSVPLKSSHISLCSLLFPASFHLVSLLIGLFLLFLVL